MGAMSAASAILCSIFEVMMDGRIDSRNRLLLRVELANGRDTLLAVVDTGFTQELLTHRAIATEVGMVLSANRTGVVVADGRSVTARKGEAIIVWHGKPRPVAVLVVDHPIDPTGGDAPTDCLIGVELMQDSELLVEFARKVFWLAHVAGSA
jgi:predicted aspartyl protease